MVETYSVVHVNDETGVRTHETIGGPGWEANVAAFPPDTAEDFQRASRTGALQGLRAWFRRSRPGYLGSARVQEFGNHAPGLGSAIHEVQTCRYPGGSIKAQAILLDFARDRPGEVTTLPHFLGMRLEGQADWLIFETPVAAAVLARHVATQALNAGAIPTYYDHAFMQVDRSYDHLDDSEYQESTRFFAEVRSGADRTFNDLMMFETEATDWMGQKEVVVKAYKLEVVSYTPTRWEKFCKLVKSIRSKPNDIGRAEEVRFIKRACGDWRDSTEGDLSSLRPRVYDI